jgi:uncharacterized protein YqjF (DUF2071 family)
MIQTFLDKFMEQRWSDLLLLHWPVPPEMLRLTIPDDLELDLFEGQAWASVVGFHLSGLRMRPVRWIPWGDFDEVNLRTYVKTADGKRGVWFHSLDSTDMFAVLGARILYGLAYRPAKISRSLSEQVISYQSSTNRLFKKVPARLDAQLDESVVTSKIAREPLDRFLLERYRFWARRKGGERSSSAQIRHRPYDAVRLQRAEYKGGLFNAFGLPEPQESPAVAHYCKGFSVEASAPQWLYKTAGHANQR